MLRVGGGSGLINAMLAGVEGLVHLLEVEGIRMHNVKI